MRPFNSTPVDGRPIALIGAGGHARETLLLLRQSGIDRDQIAGFFVNASHWTDELVDGMPLKQVEDLDSSQHQVVVAVGDSAIRCRIVSQLAQDTYYPSVVHPTALVGEDAILPSGVIVHAGCIVTCNVKIGRHVQLNRSTNVGHDSILGDFVTTAPGAIVSGNCRIGDGSYLGAMSCIRERQIVGGNCMVGMGAVVVTDVPAGSTFVGNPARALVSSRK